MAFPDLSAYAVGNTFAHAGSEYEYLAEATGSLSAVVRLLISGGTSTSTSVKHTIIANDTIRAEVNKHYYVIPPTNPDGFRGPETANGTTPISARRTYMPENPADGDAVYFTVFSTETDYPLYLDGDINDNSEGMYQYAEHQEVKYVYYNATWRPHYTSDGVASTATAGSLERVVPVTEDDVVLAPGNHYYVTAPADADDAFVGPEDEDGNSSIARRVVFDDTAEEHSQFLLTVKQSANDYPAYLDAGDGDTDAGFYQYAEHQTTRWVKENGVWSPHFNEPGVSGISDQPGVVEYNPSKVSSYSDNQLAVDPANNVIYRRGSFKLTRLDDAEDFVVRNNQRAHGPGYYLYQISSGTYFLSNGVDSWTGLGVNEPVEEDYPEHALDPSVVPHEAKGREWYPIIERTDVRLEDFKPLAGVVGDDWEALMLARDAAIENRVELKFLGKDYRFDQEVVIDQDALNIQGVGRRRRITEQNHGTVLKSTIPTGTAFRFAGNVITLKNLCITTVTDGIAIDSDLHQLSRMDSILIETRNTSHALRLGIAFTQKFSEMDIYDQDGGGSGLGVNHETKTEETAGGNLIFDNVNVTGYEYPWEMGQEADSFLGDERERRNVTMNTCQGRHGRVNMRFGNGYYGVELTNPWCEGASHADMQVHSGSGNIRVNGGQLNSADETIAGLILGHEDPDSNSDIGAVNFRGTRIRASGTTATGSGILLLPSRVANPAFAYVYHRFDMCDFLSNGGRLIRTARQEDGIDVTPKPVQISRPSFIGGTAGWGGYPNAGFDENNAAYNDHITYS